LTEWNKKAGNIKKINLKYQKNVYGGIKILCSKPDGYAKKAPIRHSGLDPESNAFQGDS